MTKKCEDEPFDCFAHQKFLLNIFGLQPKQDKFYKLYSVCFLIGVTIYPVSVIPEIAKMYYINFNEFVLSVLFGLGNINAVVCMHSLFWNRYDIMKLFDQLQHLDELSNFGNAKGEPDFIKQYKDIVRKQGYFGSAVILFILIAYTSGSVVLSLNKEKWILPLGRGPAINNNNLQFILQILLYHTICVVFYLLLFLYINLLTLISGHCKLLQKCIITSFSEHKGEIVKKYDAHRIENEIIDWESFKVQIRHIVSYHVGIIDAADQVETIFSFAILTYFAVVGTCLCLLIYHSGLKVGIMGIVVDVIGIISCYVLMIILSSYGEKITTESGEIASTCCAVDFHNCDSKIQKSLILIMLRSQRPITPTLGKLRVLSLSTMLSIFQTIYSYYTILRNMKSE